VVDSAFEQKGRLCPLLKRFASYPARRANSRLYKKAAGKPTALFH